MDLFYGFFNTLLGILATLIGFKIYRPFKSKDGNTEKEELWYRKFGTFYKIGGIFMLVLGVIKLLNNLPF
ncbi:hypothetical protein [Flavobacterium noncentrifugens]|uniref:Uncharacterized protein n=1 Tax=Flavobacterium noncentrifugens TaxID=1128970 RepID=A0A1G9DGI3_9FLAO|nr:hypothetical protein [Flavobacterium noncentrifugens]SDK62987.1 hypothetical protein SAMN04487935_3814 [Flavobacterium noncentrifugens]